jgi:uncharacterized coiled-coil DUF342 family protein
MKLAEALSRRADLQKRISQLRERLKESSKVQEGDEPTENCDNLLVELDENLAQLKILIDRINYTNMRTTDANGSTIAELISRKDVATIKVSTLRDIVEHAATTSDRYSRNEIKYVKTIDVAALRQKTDELSQELRELDMKIQSLNWTVEVIDR